MLTESTFDELYAEVVEVETNDLEQLFAEWNTGSGRESDQYRDLRYCGQCQTYIEGSNEALTHASQNHGYDAFQESNEPEYLRGIRSMSVGDIVILGDMQYACAPIGWHEIQLDTGGSGST